MSRASVQQMLFRRAGWEVEVVHPTMSKEAGLKQWRVLASPSGREAPDQVEHRGHLMLVTETDKKRVRGVERKPRPRKKSGKEGSKGTGTPQPKWLPGWKGDKGEDAPAWSKRSYATVLSGKKGEEEPEGTC